MATRTIPAFFPGLYVAESFNRKIAKASLWRKFGMSQNWIWSKHRRIYAMGGVEGHHNRVFHLNSDWGIDGRYGAELTPVTTTKGIPVVTFVVPQNWSSSTRVLVQAVVNFKTGSGSSGYIVASLQRLDGTFVAHDYIRLTSTDESDPVLTLSVNVPQDDLYQMKVYLILEDAATTTENGYTSEYIEAKFVSARYAVANAAEMGGDTPPAVWQPTADFIAADMPVASAFLKRLTENTQHLQAYRPPELCQSWLGKPNHNTSTYTEVGRYILWTPSRCNKWRGKLVVYCTHGGAGNEVRVKLNGSTQETFTALSAGENLLTVSEITVTDNQENTLSIEAKSTAAGVDWGTFVWGVTMWESGTTLALPGGTSVPANFQPLDEDALEGDDAITATGNNAYAQRAGLNQLFDNDRWLAFNRLRWLIGDWRHRVLKRAGFSDQDTIVDPRADWTPDDYVLFGGGYTGGLGGKNITVCGRTSTEDDKDGFGGSTTLGGTYDQGLPETIDGDLLGPYYYPNDFTFKKHGRRLGKWDMVRPTSVRTHADDLGGLLVLTRARRLRPDKMSTDTLGYGPLPEEAAYTGKGYLEFLWGSTVYKIMLNTGATPISQLGSGVSIPNDIAPEWLAPLRLTHTAADQTYKIRGRLPSQPLLSSTNYPVWITSHVYTVGTRVKNNNNVYECITAGTSAGAGGPTTTSANITDNTVHWRYLWPAVGPGRPEGMLFEVELLSWFICDMPLDASLLLASPYS